MQSRLPNHIPSLSPLLHAAAAAPARLCLPPPTAGGLGLLFHGRGLAASGAVSMASSAGATELAREGVTLLLLHVPPTPSLASTPRCSRSAPGSEGSRWCRQARISSTTAAPSAVLLGTGMGSHRQSDSFLLLTRLSWFINAVMITGERQLGGGWQANDFFVANLPDTLKQ